jgi:GNAT superfamily N-acetyltransferase
VTLWSLDSFYFVEHFAIYGEYRNKGYGSVAVGLILDRFKRVVLEAEPHDGGIASRRLGFYERGGFVINDFPYIQPSYHGEDGGVPLMLLSYPDRLAAPIDIAKEIYKKVY